MISFFIWNGSPELFTLNLGSFEFSLRWYGLLFAGGFLLSQQVLYYIFKKEGKPIQDIDTLTVYMVVATIVGARLGHIFFYQPEILWEQPLSVLLPLEYTPGVSGFLGLPIQFTGFSGLASHGGAFGILFALWLYSRKKKPGQNYLQILDRIVIVVALTACMIRFGNFFNSEIIGLPTNTQQGVVFIKPVVSSIERADREKYIESIEVSSLENASADSTNLAMQIHFNSNIKENMVHSFCQNTVRFIASQATEFVAQPYNANFDYQLQTNADQSITATIKTKGIVRHPAQLYESFSSLLLFAFLFFVWNKHKQNTREGLIFGLFMVTLWPMRFFYEFIKENQVPFEEGMLLNMGQILSIPLILVGVFFIYRAMRNRPTETLD